MGLLETLKHWLASIFSRDPEAARRRAELRRIHAELAELHPPFFRPKQNLVLPGFAEALYSFAGFLRPLAEIARATVGNSDIRIAQRYYDFLIECRLPEESRDRRLGFGYDAMIDRLRASLDPGRELEIVEGEFQAFLRDLETLNPRIVNAELRAVERFVDLARHDHEHALGLFDPGTSLSNAARRPEFSALEAELLVPDLVDLYYLLEGFRFDVLLRDNLVRLLERHAGQAVDEAKRAKVDKLVAQLAKLTETRLEPGLLLSLLRAAKGDPWYLPETPRERRDYFESFCKRLQQQFEKDKERLQRERHESAVAADIKALFGDAEILELEGYDEETDSYLRRESPNSLEWIKPLRVLKTFMEVIFEPLLKEPLKRILVEGYFDNKLFQNNLANVVFQCERAGTRIREFEDQMTGNGRISVTALRRYVEEMRRGKDIGQFLTRLVDSINARALSLAEDETGILALLDEALEDILKDFRKPSPDLITNLRTMAGARNKEILGAIQAGRERTAALVRIMRHFAVVRAPQLAIPGDPAAGAAAIVPTPTPDDAEPVEEL